MLEQLTDSQTQASKAKSEAQTLKKVMEQMNQQIGATGSLLETPKSSSSK
jgi:hypothetical protein